MTAFPITAMQMMAREQARPLPFSRGGLGWGLSPKIFAANLFSEFSTQKHDRGWPQATPNNF